MHTWKKTKAYKKFTQTRQGREHYKSAETKAKYVMKNEVSSFETFQMEDYCSEENEEFECVKIHSGKLYSI